ncbi:MAG: hypothetical protein IT186_24230 [Acidobacteria bacterium]|nr:hypothetical protein [Acidobacteriota bacterium]MCG3195273.1 hypothetical protein [Thermoanaerobaculia bacterium]MCK6683747.1 hypothetical protein [Thermoanaerobaculia bacterium]
MLDRKILLTLPLVLLCCGAPLQAVDINEVVRHAAERQKEAERAGKPFSFVQVEVKTSYDSDHKPSLPRRQRYLTVSEGKGVVTRELIDVDGRPATEKEKQKIRQQNEKRRRAQAGKEAGSETEDDDLMTGRMPLADLLLRFEYKLLHEEVVDGRPSYVVEYGPRPGLVSKTIRDRVLNNFAGRAWIDVAEHQVLRIEGHLLQPVKVAGGLALDLHDIKLVYEARPVLPGTWAPCFEEIKVSARAAMFFKVREDMRFEFSNYEALSGHGAAEKLLAAKR